MNIGYARVCTLEQNLVRHGGPSERRAAKIFREKVSGASRERSEFQRSISSAMAKQSSFGHSTVWPALPATVERCNTVREAGAHFQSLSESWAREAARSLQLRSTYLARVRYRIHGGRLAIIHSWPTCLEER